MQASITNHVKKHINPTDDEVAEFCAKLKERHITKGTFLLKPGHPVKEQYFVIKGCLKAYYMDAKGNKHILQFAVENWWIGDFEAFYKQEVSTIYIEAIEEAKLWALDTESLEEVLAQAPIFERYFRILVTEAFISQRKRILSSQEKNTLERYVDFCASYATIENRVANYDIANYLGVSAENLSRARQKLKKS
ncbi:hypothetical protein FFWV33_06760 [Flavobacterium faecale]|uniref:Cyclic nucleotide-binding domain-containing protein n=1 Tax=Flavobacterium faecale TaxID=1355330 RepID=A0A2S1LBZ4_9FLAO|nr:Crp/Fnr family transcriptional regulator [Flavobacterium faecale]AWG21254.1 hypothetical protein FFWV33_06760 [Flavobacterium faecale]